MFMEFSEILYSATVKFTGPALFIEKDDSWDMKMQNVDHIIKMITEKKKVIL